MSFLSKLKSIFSKKPKEVLVTIEKLPSHDQVSDEVLKMRELEISIKKQKDTRMLALFKKAISEGHNPKFVEALKGFYFKRGYLSPKQVELLQAPPLFLRKKGIPPKNGPPKTISIKKKVRVKRENSSKSVQLEMPLQETEKV